MERKSRRYRRVWVKPHYRRTIIKTFENGELIDKKVRRWCDGFWRRIELGKRIKKEDTTTNKK